MLAKCDEASLDGAMLNKWAIKLLKKNRVGPFIVFSPLNLEEQIDNMHHFFAHPEKKFKEGGGVEDCPDNISIKLKISKPTQAEVLQVQAPAASKGGGSWFLLAVSAKALTTPAPCKHGLGVALRQKGFSSCKLKFQTSKFNTSTDTLHVQTISAPEVFDYSTPLEYWIKNPESEWESHKANFTRLAPELMTELKLKPCKHPKSFSCLCHIVSARKKVHKGKPRASQESQMDFLNAQRAMQLQMEGEEEGEENPVSSAGTPMAIL